MQKTAVTSLSSPLPFGQFDKFSQPPLMAMVEITNRCNMACPICFTNALSSAQDVSIEEVTKRLINVFEVAGPIPIQISGGEPTLHPELPDIIFAAKTLGFSNIELVTNGICISQNPRYLITLVEKGLTAVYLQFDGLTKNTLITIRGQDMREVRLSSIAAVREAQICCTLAVALTPGVNEDEINDIIRFGVENIDTVRAINFQTATRFAGRFEVETAARGYDLPTLIQLIEQQGCMAPGGFSTEVIGHPHRNAMSLVYVINGELVPLFNYLSQDSLRRFLGENRRAKIMDLFMGKERFILKHLFDPSAWKLLLEAKNIFGNNPSLQSILKAKHLLLFAKSFMENDTLESNRVKKCNYAIAATDGVFSFCAYNNRYRFKHRNSSNHVS